MALEKLRMHDKVKCSMSGVTGYILEFYKAINERKVTQQIKCNTKGKGKHTDLTQQHYERAGQEQIKVIDVETGRDYCAPRYTWTRDFTDEV